MPPAFPGVLPTSGVTCSREEADAGDGDPRKRLRLAKCQPGSSGDPGGAKPRFHGFRISEASPAESLGSGGLSWMLPSVYVTPEQERRLLAAD